jgi:multidrug efflux pump subunit AcrB
LSQYLIRGTHPEAPPRKDLTDKEKLMAAEDAALSGRFRRVVNFYEHWLRFALERPKWMAAFAVVVIAVSILAYEALGTDLLPAMDEGGFIVDYLSPAGSSLQETNRMVSHVEQMLRETPEVESTSRRTGLELGLAAVTAAARRSCRSCGRKLLSRNPVWRWSSYRCCKT